MGMSIEEFRVTMEVYEAMRVGNAEGSRYPIIVPRFNIQGVDFIHSGSYYVVQRGNKVPNEIMEKAMAAVGETHPGGKHFWWGEIHSVRGMHTLAAMLEGKYSKELIDKLTNETYKRLLDSELIKKNHEFEFKDMHSPKMEELYKLLIEYHNIVNPFGNAELKLKDPIKYLDSIDISLSTNNGSKRDVNLCMETNSAQVTFHDHSEGWCYDTFVNIQKYRRNGYVNIGHYYNNGKDHRDIDEVVRLYYKVNRQTYREDHNDIDLRISLKTGLAWKTYREEQAALATDKQIEIMSSYLENTIKKVKRRVLNNMIAK